jgi:flagellar biosynthesis protein FliR
MSLDQVLQFVPSFVLVFFRLAAMMLFAPLFGSARVPRRLKLLFASILAFSMMSSVPAGLAIPTDGFELAISIGAEIFFGLAMGMIVSMVFIAAQWAGEIIGQQMGFNLSEVFDPQFGSQSSLVGEMYFMLMLVVFLMVGGHHAMLYAVRGSFDAMPLLSVRADMGVLDIVVGLFHSATVLGLQLAAPMLVSMLIVDLALGFLSKTVPQLNVMTAGLTIRAMVGMLMLILGLITTNDVMQYELIGSLNDVMDIWTTPASPAEG